MATGSTWQKQKLTKLQGQRRTARCGDYARHADDSLKVVDRRDGKAFFAATSDLAGKEALCALTGSFDGVVTVVKAGVCITRQGQNDMFGVAALCGTGKGRRQAWKGTYGDGTRGALRGNGLARDC